jgi:hypothetical protein
MRISRMSGENFANCSDVKGFSVLFDFFGIFFPLFSLFV